MRENCLRIVTANLKSALEGVSLIDFNLGNVAGPVLDCGNFKACGDTKITLVHIVIWGNYSLLC
jgi:hypothetical protein